MAASIQRGLASLAKPWYRRRALRVFRDKTSLAASPEGWPSIVAAMERSRFFILLASPEATHSPWVEKEVNWWRDHRDSDTLFIAVTAGEFGWCDSSDDFDDRTEVPPSLRGWFASEPFWADFRWYRGQDNVDLRDPRLREPLADLAAPLRGMDKDELVGEDIAQHRRAIRQAWAVAAVLVLLTVGASIAAIIAVQQRHRAIEQRDIAQARALAATSNAERASDPQGSLRDALASLRIRQTEQGVGALTSTLASPLRRILNTSNMVNDLAFSPDGQHLAAAVRGTVTVWDLPRTGTTSFSAFRAPVDEVSFSGNGRKLVAVAEDGTAHVWDLAHNGPAKVIQIGQLESAALAPDGETLALSTYGGVVEITDLAGHVIRVLAHSGPVSFSSLQFSPDGSHLLGEGNNGTLEIWAVAANGPPVVLRGGRVLAARISTSGGVIGVSSSGVLNTWSLDGGHHRSIDVGPSDAAAISPDGNQIALGARNGTVSVVDERGDAPRVLGRHPGGGITAMAFSADGRSLATAAEGDTLLRLWDLETMPPTTPPGGPFYADALTFSPNDGLVAGFESDGSDVAVWPSGGGPRTLLHNGPGGILAIAFDRNGDGVTTVADNGVEQTLPVAGGPPINVRGGLGSPAVAALSADATLVATTGDKGPLRIWKSDGGPPVTLAPRIRGVYDIAFSPDKAKIAAANSTKSIEVWSTKGGAPVRLRAPVQIDHVAFNNDGTALAGGSEDTGSVYLWRHLTSGQRPTFLGRHLHFLDALAFSPAGDQVASGGDDGELRIWNLEGGSELALPSGHAIVDAVAFNPQSSSLTTSDNTGHLEVWSCEFCGPIGRVVEVGRRLLSSGGLN